MWRGWYNWVMKCHKKFLILLFVIFFASFGTTLHAQEISPALNAGVVSDIWYSPTTVYEGDQVKIYSGVYNSSEVRITGKASYFIDAEEIQKVPFVSDPKSLVQIEAHWTATSGDHKIQIKIATSTKSLSKIESNEAELSVQRRITKESLQRDATNFLTKTVEVIDPYAQKLAGNIEELGNSLNTSDTDKNIKINSPKNQKTKTATTTDLTKDTRSLMSLTNTLLKSALDGAGFLVRHWAWTLFGIVIIYFIIKRRRKKESWW